MLISDRFNATVKCKPFVNKGRRAKGLPPWRVTKLPAAGRTAQMERHGLRPEYVGERSARGTLDEDGGLAVSGFHVVAIKGGDQKGGLTSHRGTLHPSEYVDGFELRVQVEAALGYTYEEVLSVYRKGPLSADQRELRGKLDARLLALSDAGGNMVELGKALGFKDNPGGHPRAIKNALGRARKDNARRARAAARRRKAVA